MATEVWSIFSACDFGAGWASGICGLVVGHPLDTIKVRQQILGKTGFLRIVTSTLKHEGILGFYKGMMFPLLTAGTLNSIFFGVYGNSLRVLEDARKQPIGRTLCCEGGPAYRNFHWDVYYAGCAGGAATVLLSTPIELVKTQLQSQVGDKVLKGTNGRLKDYTGPWDCLKDLYKANGIRGCFRGLVPMLWRDVGTYGLKVLSYEHITCMLRDPAYPVYKSPLLIEILAGAAADVPTYGLYTLTYEHVICMLRDPLYREHKSSIICEICAGSAAGIYMSVYAHGLEEISDTKTTLSVMMAGGLAGFISWATVVPVDVVKSRIQADNRTNPKYKGMIDCFLKSYKADGITVFFRGFTVTLVRALPVNAATFVGYEFFISHCQKRKQL